MKNQRHKKNNERVAKGVAEFKPSLKIQFKMPRLTLSIKIQNIYACYLYALIRVKFGWTTQKRK